MVEFIDSPSAFVALRFWFLLLELCLWLSEPDSVLAPRHLISFARRMPTVLQIWSPRLIHGQKSAHILADTAS
jgi:hypothetical protein